MSIKVQDYITSEDVHVKPYGSNPWSEAKIVKAGTFVKPIDARWVPKHVLEDPNNRYYNKETEMFCYCSIGIVLMPKTAVRETYS